jgi:glyoxylase I family protein
MSEHLCHIALMPNLIGLHHVALTVSDCNASVEWYGRVLGMGELFREEAEARRGCVMCFPNGSFSVGLVEHVPSDQAPFDPRRRGLDHFAFTVETRDELDQWVQRLDEATVTHSGVIDVSPGAILNFKDPDGIALALFWERT